MYLIEICNFTCHLLLEKFKKACRFAIIVEKHATILMMIDLWACFLAKIVKKTAEVIKKAFC